MKVNEMLRLACIYAEQDREGFLSAMEPCRNNPEDQKTIEEAERFLKSLRAYRLRRWGKSRRDKLDDLSEGV